MKLGLLWTVTSLQGTSQTKPDVENLRGLGFFKIKTFNKVVMAVLPAFIPFLKVGFVHCSKRAALLLHDVCVCHAESQS